MSEKTLTVTEAARNFAELVNRAYYRHESTLLMKNNLPVARIIPIIPIRCSAHELAESWKEIPHMTPLEAEEFESDLKTSKRSIKQPRSRWD